MHLLRNKALAFIGDSITEQVSRALECAVRAHFTDVRKLHRPFSSTALNRACTNVSSYRTTIPCARDVCRKLIGADLTEALLPSAGSCRDLIVPRSGGSMRTHFKLRGFFVPATNSSIYFRFGAIATSRHPCTACVARVNAASQGSRCSVANVCDARVAPLPTHMQLIQRTIKADAVVVNWGLHYRRQAVYESEIVEVLREMAAFGRRADTAAVFRESSAQHFAVESGDYHEALRRDPSLVVLARNTTSQAGVRERWHEFHGASFCRPRAQPTILTWRNRVLHELLAREGWQDAVAIQPFEQLTATRWDYHLHPVGRNGRWSSDCTHFCYSPRFWDRSFHDLYVALSKRFGMRSTQ